MDIIKEALLHAKTDLGACITIQEAGSPLKALGLRGTVEKIDHALLETEARPEYETLQARVAAWGEAAFGEQMTVESSTSVLAERSHRFLEEALELVQATGTPKDEAIALVDYVFSRPAGEIGQEIGGVMMCLALLSHKQGWSMMACAETELARIWTKIDAIRAKRLRKPEFGPLPGKSLDISP